MLPNSSLHPTGFSGLRPRPQAGKLQRCTRHLAGSHRNRRMAIVLAVERGDVARVDRVIAVHHALRKAEGVVVSDLDDLTEVANLVEDIGEEL